MNPARRLAGIVVTLLLALAALVMVSHVSHSRARSEHDTLQPSHLVLDDRAAIPTDPEADSRARASKRGPPNPFAARPLSGFEAPAATFTLGVAVLGPALYLGRDPAAASWASGAIRYRAPPRRATV